MTDINPILPEITVIVRALHSKQKAESGRIGLKKKKNPTICCLQETYFDSKIQISRK